MKNVLLIAVDEWRYWLRSHIALSAMFIFFVLVLITSLLTTLRMDAENHLRTEQQGKAEKAFLAQPDRHPHRMVHYGHYLFRAPTPLALFDPGLDPVTGQSIFLEGHRKNTVMFAESAASADMGGLSWLNPAMVYQLFAPIVIILLGHGSIAREREAALIVPLLAMGISGRTLVAGKFLALLSFTLCLLIPLIGSCAVALSTGATTPAILSLAGVYGTYLTIWALLTLLASTLIKKRSNVLATMTAFWLGCSLVLPSAAVNIATDVKPIASKIESDMILQADLRKLGDGHNANDKAFKQLKSDLLKKYNVTRVEDLPVNFRGVVALESEQKLTTVLNRYAASRILTEAQQEDTIRGYGWLTPTLAINFASRSIAGTDLAHYHRFQAEAETIRFAFVQKLNRAHAAKLSYEDDISRNKNEASSRRARVDASNWQVLDEFQFQTADLSARLANAFSSIASLLAWLILSLTALFWRAARIKP
ncbi:MAG: DUF3526 domain-containing protein [Pseudomonadales bacterium]|nr:DUF3526 domain-containing protein [Pseudomonadales bacterium]